MSSEVSFFPTAVELVSGALLSGVGNGTLVSPVIDGLPLSACCTDLSRLPTTSAVGGRFCGSLSSS